MNILRSDLEKICNYVESDKPSLPVGNIFYMDNITAKDEWVINQKKRINRQNAINEVLDEQEDNESNDWVNDFSGDDMGVVSPRLMTLSVKSKTFNSYDDLYDDIILHLDSITSGPMKTLSKFGNSSGSLNIQKSNDSFLSNSENDDATLRRIITKLTFCNNLISMMSMVGPANTVIVGDEIFYHLMSANDIISKDDNNMFIMNLNLVRSSKIKKNKCIVLRTSGQLGCGVCVSKHNDGRYFLKETPNYEKTIVWFELN